MFEVVTVRGHVASSTNFLDIGQLAESMLFYGEVNLITSLGTIKSLFECAEPEVVAALVDGDFVKLRMVKSVPMVITSRDGDGERHDFGYVSSRDAVFQNQVHDLVGEYVPKRGRARRVADRILRKVDYTDYADDVPGATRSDLADGSYVADCGRDLLAAAFPTAQLPREIVLSTRALSTGEYRLESNVDFDGLPTCDAIGGVTGSFTSASLLGHFLQARGEMELAARFGGDLATDPVLAIVIERLTGRVLRNSTQEEVKSGLQEFAVTSRRIGEVINSGDKSLADFLPVLERASKFRSWLRAKEYDADAVTQYLREVTAESWVDTLPTKTARWALFAAAGYAIGAASTGPLGIAGALSISALDSLLLDRLIRGWRPNLFITGPLRRFLSP